MPKKAQTPEASVSHLLHRAVQVAADLHAERAGPDGLTPRQYAILVAVAEAEGSTQTQLVAATGVDRSTLAELLARLTARGLVARVRSESDARVNHVTLTPEGQALLGSAAPLAAAADDDLLQRLPADRRARFLKDLRRLIAGPGTQGGAGKKKKKKAKAAR